MEKDALDCLVELQHCDLEEEKLEIKIGEVCTYFDVVHLLVTSI